MLGDRNLVVGCGISGAVIAYKIAAELGQKVVIIDTKNHVAGNCYDYYDANGICIHKYGSHIFHTSDKYVWDFLRQFTKFNTYMHKVIAVIDGIETFIPFNLKTIYDVFPKSMAKRMEEKLLQNFEYNKKVPILEFQKQEDEDLQFLAQYIYDKVFLYYTTKQWGTSPDEVDSAVTARVPVYISCDERYFQDVYQGIPIGGYTQMIEKMLDHPNIEVRLNTHYKDLKESFKSIFWTGSIDEFLDYKYGVLPYRSVYFELEEHNVEYYQNGAVVNYPCNYDFTRIHEYKYYLNDTAPRTVIAKEYSQAFELGKNDRYYPIAGEKSEALYGRYLHEVSTLSNVYFLGRLGDYKYYDMDKAVKRALEVVEIANRDAYPSNWI